MSLSLPDLAGPANALAPHYARFRVAERLLLTGHSHQAWPDVAREGQLEAYDDAALAVDQKWERAFSRADEVRDGLRGWLGDPRGAGDAGGEVVLGASTHELVVRFLSALDLRGRSRLVTTDGEFHSIRRQLARLGEEGLDVLRVPAEPVATLSERLADAVDGRTAAVLVSSVLFETSRVVPGLDGLASTCARHGAELLVDAYHQLGVLPMPLHELGLGSAWVVGGGYKYLQLGEGNCFLRLPPQAASMRPVVTGWYAEFGALDTAGRPGQVAYASGAARFAGSTYDPTSHYRASRVLRFWEERGMTPDLLAGSYRHQRRVLADAFDALGVPDDVVTRDRDTADEGFGAFLALTTPRASSLVTALRERGVHADSRGTHLRLGPAPYLSDAQLEAAVGVLGEVLRG